MGEFLNQPSCAAGVLAPELHGRIDLDLYYIGLRKAENFIVLPWGGVANRAGTQFIAECRYPDKKSRLIEFQFNEIQTYALEFGDFYMRVVKDGEQVLEANKVITGATAANPIVITSNAHGYSNGDDVYISGVAGMVELNGRAFRVANVTANTFELKDFTGANINGSAYSAYTSGGNVARLYTVVTPWAEDDLFDLNFAQSNDVLSIVHPDYYVRDVTRTADDAWTVNLFSNAEGPFKDVNITSTTVKSSATSGTVIITADTGIFSADMVGELFYIEQMPNDTVPRWEPGKTVAVNDIRRAGSHYYKDTSGTTTGTVRPDHIEGTSSDGGVVWEYLHSGFGIVKFTGFTSSTEMTAEVIKTLPDAVVTPKTTEVWARAAWSNAEGYPASVCYHKQRFMLGGTKQQPHGLWMSGTSLRTYFGKSNPILDDDAITLFLDTNQVSAIRHLIPLRELIALTSSSEQVINGADNNLLATEPPLASVQGYRGSSRVMPIIIGNTALFVSNKGGSVRNLQYNLNEDSFTGDNLSLRSAHFFRRKKIIDWSYQQEPHSIVWTILNDGTLLSLTYLPEQLVSAWSNHKTEGLFESTCAISEEDETATYFVVNRTINGNSRRFIERLSSRYFDSIRDAYFVDCGLSYDGRNASTTTITVSGGMTWDVPEVLTLTASTSIFKPADINDQIVFWTDEGVALRLTITAYTSGTVVSAIPTKALPVAYQNTARSDWEFARNKFLPLNHLEGKEVAVLADGNVVEGLTVTNGAVTLPSPAAVVHIGLPYISNLETLDITTPPSSGNSIKAKTINVPRVIITAQETRALEVSTDGKSFYDVKERDPSIGYDAPIPAGSGLYDVITGGSWSNTGRVSIRQRKPLPVTINCITPEVILGNG